MKKPLLQLFLLTVCMVTFYSANAQSVQVTKTNPMKVYMHYMPWFDAPINPVAGGTYTWGYHWKMNTMNPNIIGTDGQRQIASHYYPLIGPYASKDPDVIEYHLLLMKLSGVDGVLIDWYGKTGKNGDINSLLTNSDALINKTGDAGIGFAVIAEDRFWGTVQDGKNAMAYARDNYFTKANYIHQDTTSGPLFGLFGPVTFNSPDPWTQILAEAGTPVQFLPLNGHANQVGTNNEDGEYMWVYSDFTNGLVNFYANTVPRLKSAMGAVYPRFNDFYAQGGAGNSLFNIPDNNGKTLDTTLALANKYKANIASIQLITFNDFGEGTNFEPTVETGYKDLVRIQQYTGVPYTQADLEQVYRLFTLRKKYVGDAGKQTQLNQVFTYFTTLQIDKAVALMDNIENINSLSPIISVTSNGSLSENGSTGNFTISATNITSDATVNYTIAGTAVPADYIASPALSGSVTLSAAAPSVTITISPIDDTVVDPKETIILTINTDTAYRISKTSAILTIEDNETPPCSASMIINTTVAPAIDGAADAVWSRAPINNITKTVNGVLQNDYAATWKAMYDDTYLYVLVEVKDSALKRDAAQSYANDVVEIYLDGKNEKASTYDANDFQYGFRWGFGTDAPTTANIYGTPSRTGVVYAIPSVKGGYNLEAKIPWTTINGGAPFNGREIGFDVEINDNDKNATRQATSGWYASANNAFNNPSVFGTATLTVCTGNEIMAAPVIISVDSVVTTTDTVFNYQVLASNNPTGYDATGLPQGLTIDNQTGIISGTVTAGGNFIVTIKATNATGTDSKTLLITSVVKLPLEYILVDAYRSDSVININWTVTSQSSIKEYEVQESADGINFTTLGITPVNNSGDTVSYTIPDTNPSTGVNFYRIKGITYSNKTDSSNIVKVDAVTITSGSNIYPNPLSANLLYLVFNNNAPETYKLRVINSAGQTIYNTIISINTGYTKYELHLYKKPAPGLYHIQLINSSGHSKTRKLIVQ